VKNYSIHGHIQEIPQILPEIATLPMDEYSPTIIMVLAL
jgi:hypothetical protein